MIKTSLTMIGKIGQYLMCEQLEPPCKLIIVADPHTTTPTLLLSSKDYHAVYKCIEPMLVFTDEDKKE